MPINRFETNKNTNRIDAVHNDDILRDDVFGVTQVDQLRCPSKYNSVIISIRNFVVEIINKVKGVLWALE